MRHGKLTGGLCPNAYFYATKLVPACPGQAEPASPAWVNVDETTEIGLDQMFAGGPAIEDSANTSPQLIRFAVKANHVEYGYVAKNQYFLRNNVQQPAMNNVNAYTASPPVAPTPPFISFTPGTVEIKSAWRPLNAYDNPARLHVQTVRFYEEKGPNNSRCYFEQKWGLIALHIIQKTPSAPAFIYATFEQADNIRQPNGTPVEDPDGNIAQPIPGAAPTTPALAYEDSAPKVTAKGAFCKESKLPKAPSQTKICAPSKARKPITAKLAASLTLNGRMDFSAASSARPALPRWLPIKRPKTCSFRNWRASPRAGAV
jgi:hypothetical protein